MWNFFSFGKSKADQREGPATLPPQPQQHLDAQKATQHRELIRIVLRDTLKRHGIPVEWIGYELSPLADAVEGDPHLVHLVVMRWHEHLMNFAPALQEQLAQGIKRITAGNDAQKFVLGWKFSPDCGCPFSTLPEASFWLRKAAELPTPAAPTSAAPAPPKKFDLPESEYDHRSSGFAPTQPGEIT